MTVVEELDDDDEEVDPPDIIMNDVDGSTVRYLLIAAAVSWSSPNCAVNEPRRPVDCLELSDSGSSCGGAVEGVGVGAADLIASFEAFIFGTFRSRPLLSVSDVNLSLSFSSSPSALPARDEYPLATKRPDAIPISAFTSSSLAFLAEEGLVRDLLRSRPKNDFDSFSFAGSAARNAGSLALLPSSRSGSVRVFRNFLGNLNDDSEFEGVDVEAESGALSIGETPSK